MKVMKLALLGTAALAAASLSARADDLSDLKAQIEALNNRIATLEAAPAVPAGYQLLSVSDAPALVIPSVDETDKSYGATANNIGILPTADVPASTNIQWSGFVRAALVYSSVDIDGNTTGAVTGFDTSEGGVLGVGDGVDADDLDILTRAELKVNATTDTAVGEVGVMVKLRANGEGLSGGGFSSPEYWGYWKMTPELTFGAGYTGTLANIGFGYDGACTCYYTDNAPVGLNPGDRTQMRLSYASGPISFAIALEDADADGFGATTDEDTLGVAGEVKYSGDGFSAEVAAGWWDGDNLDDQWQVGVGVSAALGDIANLSVAAGMGDRGFRVNGSGASPLDVGNGEYWKVSALMSANLSDSVSAEIGAGYADFDSFLGATNTDVIAVLAGIYWNPVSQLTIGLEGEYQTWDGDLSADAEAASVDLVTVFRF
jgi:hypothetical protein